MNTDVYVPWWFIGELGVHPKFGFQMNVQNCSRFFWIHSASNKVLATCKHLLKRTA